MDFDVGISCEKLALNMGLTPILHYFAKSA
jgi:hypothetical protein